MMNMFQADEVPRSDQNHTAAAGGGGDANHKKHEYKNKDSLNPWVEQDL